MPDLDPRYRFDPHGNATWPTDPALIAAGGPVDLLLSDTLLRLLDAGPAGLPAAELPGAAATGLQGCSLVIVERLDGMPTVRLTGVGVQRAERVALRKRPRRRTPPAALAG